MLSQRAERSAQEIRRLGDTSLLEAGFTKFVRQAFYDSIIVDHAMAIVFPPLEPSGAGSGAQ